MPQRIDVPLLLSAWTRPDGVFADEKSASNPQLILPLFSFPTTRSIPQAEEQPISPCAQNPDLGAVVNAFRVVSSAAPSLE